MDMDISEFLHENDLYLRAAGVVVLTQEQAQIVYDDLNVHSDGASIMREALNVAFEELSDDE